MKRFLKLTAALSLLFAALNGCSVEKLDPPAPYSPVSAVIATSLQASQAFASVLQARDLLFTSTSLFKNLGDISLNIMATDPTLASAGTTTPISCADGGSYLYTGATTTGGAYDLTVTFNGCREKRFQYEGSYKITGGTPTDITVKLGDTSSFNIFYFNSGYTVLIDYLKAQASFTMTGSGSATDAVYTIRPTGTITTFDYFLLDTFTMSFVSAVTDYTLSTDAVTRDQTTSISVTGNVTQTSITRGLTISLSGFRVDRVKRYSGGTFYADDTSVSGTALFNYRPNNYCFEGQYAVATTTPVRTDYASGRTTSGALTINGIATAQYNAGGDVDVSLTASAPLNYSREYLLMKVCDYSGLEENTPPLLGPTGSTTGSTMAVTLTWVDNTGSTSDMDLHVKYYDQTVVSSPTTTETWHIDWHQGKSCSSPAGLAFSDGLDIDGTGSGTCDVGLDFDDTNGYGPEHITSLKLPVGYYIISVNSYSLGDPPATLYLAVHIGDSIFGPYIGTLSDSDGEGESATSWYRVADVRVNADGTVDVLAPDASLDPWGTPPH